MVGARSRNNAKTVELGVARADRAARLSYGDESIEDLSGYAFTGHQHGNARRIWRHDLAQMRPLTYARSHGFVLA